jgi:hypothetical protein
VVGLESQYCGDLASGDLASGGLFQQFKMVKKLRILLVWS